MPLLTTQFQFILPKMANTITSHSYYQRKLPNLTSVATICRSHFACSDTDHILCTLCTEYPLIYSLLRHACGYFIASFPGLRQHPAFDYRTGPVRPGQGLPTMVERPRKISHSGSLSIWQFHESLDVENT